MLPAFTWIWIGMQLEAGGAGFVLHVVCPPMEALSHEADDCAESESDPSPTL
jgi:hypothetical protein